MQKRTCTQSQAGKYFANRGILILAIGFLLILLCACSFREALPGPLKTQPAAMTAEPAASALPTPEPTPAPAASAAPEASAAPLNDVFIGQVVCVADEYANIREKADTGSAITGKFPAGGMADVSEFTDGWAHISYRGVAGYVSRDYIVSRSAPGTIVPMGDWALILVNPTHDLPQGFGVDLEDFEGGRVDARILQICEEMFRDAAKDGASLELVDAYRSFDRQNELYQKKVDSFTTKGISRPEAEAKAATITARPNTSEHQTGLALDIVTSSYTSRDKGFADTRAFGWMNANAQNYGFTLRYKQDKTDITKVIYEPWHWRFVGVEAAEDMKQSGECLEEYLGALN